MGLPTYDLNDVKDKAREPIPDGDYSFVIVEATSKTAQSGKEYTKLKLDTAVTPERSVKVFDSIFYQSNTLFKLKQLVEATGMNPPKEPEDFIGQTGMARFKKNAEGFLEVKWYIHRDKLPKSSGSKHPAVKAVEAGEDNLPF